MAALIAALCCVGLPLIAFGVLSLVNLLSRRRAKCLLQSERETSGPGKITGR